MSPTRSLDRSDAFVNRHLGPREADVHTMLAQLGYPSMEAFIADTVPPGIRLQTPLELKPRPGGSQDDGSSEADRAARDGLSEFQLQKKLRSIAAENLPFRSFLGMGYHDTVTPPVILRNIFENPGWYTQYTPYQAEIAQGRLEALLNFQTVVCDLTALDIANASLLDEGTAAAEAMSLFLDGSAPDRTCFLVDRGCHPQTRAVVRTRAEALGVPVREIDPTLSLPADSLRESFGILLAYPDTEGAVRDLRPRITEAQAGGLRVVVAADLLALTLLTPPGEMGADVAVGNTQRFGVPLGYGGPHAAYMAAREEFKRKMPGRIIGVSVDADGNRALRMALQTREQHIRREKATSNICTAQVLLAVMASMYAVYHGPEGLRKIALRIHDLTRTLARGLQELGHEIIHAAYFDTLRVRVRGVPVTEVLARGNAQQINVRDFGDGTLGIALDEATEVEDLSRLLGLFSTSEKEAPRMEELYPTLQSTLEVPPSLQRESPYLEHPVFHKHQSETSLLRYMHSLEVRDLSLNTSMIPLGSCTMKLNATAEMIAVTWPEFSRVHPFAPPEQALGYQRILRDLEGWLADITGLPAVSLQPNSGAQGEYAGLLVIQAYHAARGETHRDVCLIPSSAHGTNPASAVMAGMRVQVVRCDAEGNIDLEDLQRWAEVHADRLAGMMITYPSTHGVFEEGVRAACDLIHSLGGQVYMDGANLNAQVGLCRPGDFGADVVHINLHKTFAIPHGGGGPGMGPICVASHLGPFLPGHPVIPTGGDQAIGPVSAAPWGSASILLISWAYISLLGARGLTRSSEVAILSANYMAKRLEGHYDVLFRGRNGRVAHEFILDLRPFRKSSGITEEDVAKRLMDYGYHAPTMSWPVPGTIMVEPTESESLEELERFCSALIRIREEIRLVELGVLDPEDNPLRNAPHTAESVLREEWTHPYSREQAAFPAPWTREQKFWPTVRRVDNAFGDRNLVCSCPPVDAYLSTN